MAPAGTLLKSLAEQVNKALVIDNTHDEELEIPVTANLLSREKAPFTPSMLGDW